MSEEKKIATAKSGVEPDREPDRRAFFVKLGLGSLSIAAAGVATFSYRFLSPNVLYEPSPLVNAGKPDNYAVDSVTLDANSGIYIVHVQQGFFALSAVCTHLGCMTAWEPELGIITCPCHGSRFNRDGSRIAGPAPKSLPWLQTAISDDRDLIVDRSRQIDPMKFVKV
jgi:cytochrome b6-f complex iron-sulfur subunit